MSFLTSRVRRKSSNEKTEMDITSDFARLKVSALKKVLHISREIDCITIGPQSTANKNDSWSDKLENIENEQNSCNIKCPQRPYISPKHNNMISMSNGIPFSIKKILTESELQRKEEVRKNIERHIRHMNENDRAIQEQMANSCSSMARERERRNAEKLACIVAEEERIAEQEEIKRRQAQQLHAQHAREQKERLAREVEEYKRLKEQEELTKAMFAQRSQIMVQCYDIVAMIKSCKDNRALNMLPVTKLKEFYQQIEAIDEKIRNGDVVAADLDTMETLVCYIDEISNSFQKDIEKINAQYEAELATCKTQTDNEVRSVAVTENLQSDKTSLVQWPNETDDTGKKENQRLIVTSNQEVVVGPNVNNAIAPPPSESKSEEASKDFIEQKEDDFCEYVDKVLLQIYTRSQQFLAIYTQNYKSFLQIPDAKKFRFECQKAINIPVNAIANTNEQHLRDKYDRLQGLLTGKLSPNVMQYAQGVTYCKYHLAAKIIEQGETLVSSKRDAAFPLAAVVIALWNDHEDFGELFLAHLHEACPFSVPIFIPQQEGQSDEDYYKYLGYKYFEDGTMEQQDKFLKRMSGLMTLYASVTITRQRKGVTKTHPHGIRNAWRWLAAIMSIKPRADTCYLCATLILDMLEVSGNALWTTFPKQFRKLLTMLMEQYYPRIRDIAGTAGGPLIRLEGFLRDALAKNTIHPVHGLLPPNFW